MNKTKKKILVSSLINTLLIVFIVCIYVFGWPKNNNFSSFEEFETALSLNKEPETDSTPNFCLYKIIIYLLDNGTKGRLRNAIKKNSHLIPSIFQDFAPSNDPKFTENCVLDLLLADYPEEEASDFEPLDSFVKNVFSVDSDSTMEIPFALAQCLARKSGYSSKKAAVTLFSSLLRTFGEGLNFLFCDIVYSRVKTCLEDAVLEPNSTSYYLIEAYFDISLHHISDPNLKCYKIYLYMFQVIYEDMGFNGYLRIPFAFSKVKIQDLSRFINLGEPFYVAYVFHVGLDSLSAEEITFLETFLVAYPAYRDIFVLPIKNERSKKAKKWQNSSLKHKKAPLTHPPRQRVSSLDNPSQPEPEPLNESLFFNKLQTEGYLDVLLYYIASNKINPLFFNNSLDYRFRLEALKAINGTRQKHTLTPVQYISEYLVSMPSTLQYFITMTTFTDYCPIVLVQDMSDQVLRIIDSRDLYKVPDLKSKEFQRLYLIAKRNNLRNLLFALLKTAINNNVDMDKFFPCFANGFFYEPKKESSP